MSRLALSLALTLSLLAGCAHAPPKSVNANASANANVDINVPFAKLAPVDVPDLRTDWQPAALRSACAALEQKSDARLAKLVALPDAARTFANSFNAFEQTMADYGDAAGRLAFLKEIHPDAKVRSAAAACEERSGKYLVKVGARKDLYLALRGYLDHAGKSEPLDPVQRRLIELTMRDFQRNGLALSDADRAELVQIRQRLAELQTEFSANLDNDTTTLEASRAELRGLPAAMVARLKRAADGKYILTTKYPDYFPVEEEAASAALRKRMFFAFTDREAKRNLPLLAEAVRLRDRAAHLLGFANHADFVTADRMAKNAQAVADFLGRLRRELQPGRDALVAKLAVLKRQESHTRQPIEDWDWRYYLKELRRRDYAIDDEAVRQYFPADKVMAGMFQVYSTLFHVTFKEVPGAPVWAPGVHLYEVHEAPAGKLLAKFYIDLFPRPGKYGHAASFPIGVARRVPTGYQIPLSALVVNFNPPEGGRVARLSFEEVDTLFHEFGHIMHNSLTTARYASISGTNVDTDFVEAPSQMLENWVYQPAVLRLISQDPKDPSKTMPEALIEKLAAARTYDAGIKYMRQVFLATFDQTLHTSGDKVDPDALDHRLRHAILGFPLDPQEHFAASFGHLMGGYDAGYYGYLWSEVFADDMFTRFAKNGVLDPATGLAYRQDILAPGRTVEPDVLLGHFLGRAPDEHAFLRIIGVEKAGGPAVSNLNGSKPTARAALPHAPTP